MKDDQKKEMELQKGASQQFLNDLNKYTNEISSDIYSGRNQYSPIRKKPNLSIEQLDKVYQSPGKEDETAKSSSTQFHIEHSQNKKQKKSNIKEKIAKLQGKKQIDINDLLKQSLSDTDLIHKLDEIKQNNDGNQVQKKAIERKHINNKWLLGKKLDKSFEVIKAFNNEIQQSDLQNQQTKRLKKKEAKIDIENELEPGQFDDLSLVCDQDSVAALTKNEIENAIQNSSNLTKKIKDSLSNDKSVKQTINNAVSKEISEVKSDFSGAIDQLNSKVANIADQTLQISTQNQDFVSLIAKLQTDLQNQAEIVKSLKQKAILQDQINNVLARQAIDHSNKI